MDLGIQMIVHVQKLSTNNGYIKPTVYSIRDTNITTIVPAIFDSFSSDRSATLSEMNQVRGWMGGRWGAGSTKTHANEKPKPAFSAG